MKTGVIYARYSSDSQTEQSIEGQLRVCNEYAKKNNIIIIDTYIDRAVSGTTDNRIAFQKMIKDSYKKQFDVVIVYKLDRFSRNKYESVVHKKTLKDNGVKLISAMENIPDTPEGTLMEALLEGFNQYYSEELAQKVNRGIRESWLKGNCTGGYLMYGYDRKDKKLYINEYEASIVVDIFTMYSQGFNAKTILNKLNQNGIVRKTGKPFNEKAIYLMLHNKKYTGILEHNGEVYDKVYPRIISDDLWEKVQLINEDNKIVPSRKKEVFEYFLSGKLYCGLCKERMSGESGTSKTGDIHYYYVCLSQRKNRHDCKVKSVKKSLLEDMVINHTLAFLKNDKAIDFLSEKIYNLHMQILKDDTALNILIKQKDDAVKASNNLIKAIEQGIITEQTKSRLIELEKFIMQKEIEIDKEKLKNYSHLSLDDIKQYLKSVIYDNADKKLISKLIINTFIREVIYYPDRIIITYNFTDKNDRPKVTKEYLEQIEKQSENSQAVFSFPISSSILNFGAPVFESLALRQKN